MPTWPQSEYMLKGIYLGLLVTIAWMKPQWHELAIIALITLTSLVLFLVVSAVSKVRAGQSVKDHWVGFLVFLLLENPRLVYAGMLVGLSLGTVLVFGIRERSADVLPTESVYFVCGGALLGYIFYCLGHVRRRTTRFWLSLAMAMVLSAGAAAFYYFDPDASEPAQRRMIGILLLLGIPGFYLLTFTGLVEESEIEIGAMCAALGISAWALTATVDNILVGATLTVMVPLCFYLTYTTTCLPALRVFKHALRGMSYRQMGQTKHALVSLTRAIELDSRNPLARQQLWDIHRDLDFAKLQHQPDIVPYLNFNFCLERISQLLQTKPNPAELGETLKMLDLIAAEKPELDPVCSYWRAVARLHEHNYEEAAKHLLRILQLPQMQTQARQSIHYAAWYLAMFGHPEMAKRVAQPLFALPGHRMDAIAAVEAQLALSPQDANVWDMKRQLYSDLTEREYWTLVPGDGTLPRFNYEYTQQLGLALIDDAKQWPRGCEYLRIAAHGLPAQAANLYVQIAETHEKHGDEVGLWANYEKAMQIGRRVGVDNITGADRETLFTNVKKVGELAVKRGQIDTALEAFKFYSLNESAGIETYRMLAELFEKKADIWQALHCCEHALSYHAADKDLLERKDRYYYSIAPADLFTRLESVRKWFDPQYCRDKARWVIEKFNGDFELLDWAMHLTELALVAQPGSHAARLLKVRIHRLRGEIPETIAMLEEIRQHRPEKFFNEEEEKAWFFAHRMLGDLYLDSRPDEAVACYREFRQCNEAGADTSFKMGKAFEALGDLQKAAICYGEVTVFEKHPLFYEARDALDRVKRGARAAR